VQQPLTHTAAWPKGLAIDLNLAPDLLPVKASSAQLLRVILNLLTNAREAMQDTGAIKLKTENVYVDRPLGSYNRVEIGEYVRLEVSDTGCGILLEIRDKIFDAFFTTKRTDRRRGSGLGLTVVQAIVKDHGGYLDLESEEGKGTTFTIYLPVCREATPQRLSSGYPGGTETILVADDDPAQRQVARELLSRLGYRVETVASGEEALAYLQHHAADLLILDMVMPPGIDGAETYRRVVQMRPGQKATIVSGHAASERVRLAQSLGAGPHLAKPVTLERLASAVRSELDRH
jgi:CheY-like chemotaxis protein